ncbi:glycosyltransferase family 2 protein [Autumnicola edwardsiae]|uniref:Glycosyltransferase family 2 protein n=1 Tax=Autumnicola edwardsiae TaxID=3075594 RepID=A0ABU3CRE1_9FLAO|nr:glycosyltransferase family 2 protein [Zunongwangia sp. F297]MDT0648856.1 glycosyltransferase family 2 protein [Zunongwangia sp. F297]
MEDPSPKITILLATFNRSALVGETLDSIIAQTYHNWECIIVDDHSKDNTEVVISSYLEKESRFSYFRKTEKYKPGLSGTRNYGLDLAAKRGAGFIQFFDDDDIMHPRKLELQMEPFLNNPEIDLTLCQYRKFHNKETIEFNLDKADDGLCSVTTDNLLKSFYLNEIDLNSSGPLWKAYILKNYRFLEDLFYAEEKEFYLRVFYKEKIKYEPIKLVLFWYRKHNKSITSNLYSDPSIKLNSAKLFEEKFLNMVLEKKNAPYFLLKSYTAKFIKNKNLLELKRISEYIKENSHPINFKYWILLIYIKLKSFEIIR